MLAVLALGVAAAAAPSPFVFHVLDGWIDVSPGAPAENFARLPSAAVEYLRGESFVFVAANLDVPGGFIESAAARLTARTVRIDEDSLDRLVAGGERVAEERGSVITLVDERTMDIHGVTCGRVVERVRSSGRDIAQIEYVLPGATQTAILTYTTTPERIDAFAPVFDSAASQTLGLVQPPAARDPRGAARRWALIAIIVALGGAAAFVATRRVRRA